MQRYRPLILCADDYAASAAISCGIAELARGGRISATSAMTLSPRWPQDAAALHELRGQIDVGLHLDWTSAFAVAAGHGATLPRTMLRAALGGINRQTARIVIERQLDAFEAVWQAPPDHVDGHQHVQQFAGIRDALLDSQARRDPQRKPWLRISRLGAGQGGLKGRVIGALGAAALARQAAQADWPCAFELWGVYDFTGGADRYAALVDGWLAHAAAHAVLMCHPAQGTDGNDPITAARQWEFGFLGNPAFAQALAKHGIRLVRGRSNLETPIGPTKGDALGGWEESGH
jgi:predicted glycoside hydrolase/deacetylase ChbG (UPF0249 family)